MTRAGTLGGDNTYRNASLVNVQFTAKFIKDLHLNLLFKSPKNSKNILGTIYPKTAVINHNMLFLTSAKFRLHFQRKLLKNGKFASRYF
ncbi:MAG: hypothetical protein C4554_09340 [Dethiobacter sp.]|nr:MAG: hypothetical protein C4554_09340 [Dethiobacter sp.]